jgi:hypothetical protein
MAHNGALIPGQVPERVPLERRHPPLSWVVDRFHLDMDALRGMLADFVPVVMERELNRLGSKALAELESLDPERQEKLRTLLDSWAERARRGEKGNPPPEELERWAPTFREIFDNDQHSLVSLIERMRKRTAGPSAIAIVYNSLLTQAISAFEVLVSGIVTRFYVAHPDALGTDTKEFSLAELRTFEDIDDAADALIATRVAALMFGGLDDWSAWFKKNSEENLGALAMNWSDVVEAFQRRHVVIHNGGLVSRQYLSRVPEATLALGQRMPIDPAYLQNAFDQLDMLGTVLGVRAWGAWHPDERDQAAAAILQRSYESMLISRWSEAECLCSAAANFKCPAMLKEALKVNGWNSRSELYGLEHVHAEVEAWDVSASADRFKLAKLVLLGELEEASSMADTLLERKELERGELAEWPVLRRLREHRAGDDTSGTQPDC